MQCVRVIVGCALGLVLAAPAFAAGDPVKGQSKAAYCYGCHQIGGYRNASPPYSVPKLGGQHAAYIVAALKAYQSGARPHPTMRAIAASLKEQDMADLAAYYAQPAAAATKPKQNDK